jgi:RimJ/RimL family protein N-acetyltransferase
VKPVVLRSERLVLSVPTADDADRVYEYCQDPLFERYLTVPWPYRRHDATVFLTDLVPRGWDTGSEYTWALRDEVGAPLLGMVGSRVINDPNTVDVGYWHGECRRSAASADPWPPELLGP